MGGLLPFWFLTFFLLLFLFNFKYLRIDSFSWCSTNSCYCAFIWAFIHRLCWTLNEFFQAEYFSLSVLIRFESLVRSFSSLPFLCFTFLECLLFVCWTSWNDYLIFLLFFSYILSFLVVPHSGRFITTLSSNSPIQFFISALRVLISPGEGWVHCCFMKLWKHIII